MISQQESEPPSPCSPLGHPTDPDGGPHQPQRGISGLLLDFGSPAQCSGTVTAWNYCFHHPQGPNPQGMPDYQAKFVLYRRDEGGSGPNRYMAVPMSVSTLSLSLEGPPSGAPVSCGALNLTRPISVKKNDVVGVCLRENRALDMVSAGGMQTGVYLSEEPDYQSCADSQIMSIDTSRNFNSRETLRMHLSAHIGKSLMKPPSSESERESVCALCPLASFLDDCFPIQPCLHITSMISMFRSQ